MMAWAPPGHEFYSYGQHYGWGYHNQQQLLPPPYDTGERKARRRPPRKKTLPPFSEDGEKKGRRRGGKRHGRRKATTSPIRHRDDDKAPQSALIIPRDLALEPGSLSAKDDSGFSSTSQTPAAGVDNKFSSKSADGPSKPVVTPEGRPLSIKTGNFDCGVLPPAFSPELSQTPKTVVSARRAWRRTISWTPEQAEATWFRLDRAESTDEPIPESLLFAHNAIAASQPEIIATPRDASLVSVDWPATLLDDEEPSS